MIYHYDIPFLDDNEMMSISHPSSQNVLLPKGDSRCTRPGQSHLGAWVPSWKTTASAATWSIPGAASRFPGRGTPWASRAWDHRKMGDFPGKMGKNGEITMEKWGFPRCGMKNGMKNGILMLLNGI